jgi:hypothetical protein
MGFILDAINREKAFKAGVPFEPWQEKWNTPVDPQWQAQKGQLIEQLKNDPGLARQKQLVGGDIGDHLLRILEESPNQQAYEAHANEWARQHPGKPLGPMIGFTLAGLAGGAAGGAAAGAGYGGAVSGAAGGAVAGGANAGISGQNILEGAAKGGAMGAVGGGLADMYGGGAQPTGPGGMPPAQAMNPSALQGMGMEQFSNGVWGQPGGGGYMGAPGMSMPDVGGQNFSSPTRQVEQTNFSDPSGMETNEFGGYTQDPNYSPMEQNFDPAGGGSTSGVQPESGGAPGPTDYKAPNNWLNADTALKGLGVGGTLYNLYQQDKFQDQMGNMVNQANSEPKYDYSQNWDQVQKYLNDPMSLLRNNPGYLASVDFVEKEGRRHAAKGGYNVSGNKTHYLADVMGKNAQKWHEAAWAPIRDSAGLQRPDQSANLGNMNVNALNAINRSKTQALGSLFDATGKAIPDIFKMFA